MHIFPQRAPLQELGNEIFKLVSYSASPEQWAEWLRVPLEHAVARGNLDLVNTLLEAGADGSAGWRGCRGRTLLDAAAVGGNPDVVTTLLEAGAQPDVNVVALSPKRSALFAALVCGHEEVARRLIQAGADVTFEDPVAQGSVLHEACCGSEQLVNDLLVAGADPNSVFGPNGSTPLHQAASAGQCGSIAALLLRGVNKDALDQSETTPFVWAAAWGQLAAMETLLAAGADFNLRENTSHYSALDIAACRGHVPVIKAILGRGVVVNSRDSSGYSALHKAAETNQEGAVNALVEAGANVELMSNTDQTPLQLAAFFGSRKSLLALLKLGAIVRTCDKFGWTPLHMAYREGARGLEVVVDLLLRWGADETALTNDGKTPADVLNQTVNDGTYHCAQREVERARLLLTRAPADRAWRRRGWLVMLQARAAKARASTDDHHGGGSDANLAGDGEGNYCTAAREGPGGAERSARSEGSNRSSRGRWVGGQRETGILSSLVKRLVELELDGVFRQTVGFL